MATVPATAVLPLEVKHLKDEIAKLKKAIEEGGGSEELTDELKERHRLVGHYSKCGGGMGFHGSAVEVPLAFDAALRYIVLSYIQ